MKSLSVSAFALSFLILSAIPAEAGESAWTDAGIRSEISAVSRSSGGNASSSVSSTVRSSGGEAVVETAVSAESDGERIDLKEISHGEDIDIRQESDSGNAAVSVSIDIDEADGEVVGRGSSGETEEAEEELSEESAETDPDGAGWWSGAWERFLEWFR